VSWEVPVHVLSGDSSLVHSFEEWGFDPGPLPNRDHSERGMDLFREWFVRTFSSAPGAVAEAETR
jgi:hypothetical protein